MTRKDNMDKESERDKKCNSSVQTGYDRLVNDSLGRKSPWGKNEQENLWKSDMTCIGGRRYNRTHSKKSRHDIKHSAKYQ
jgi:hypothetical protein